MADQIKKSSEARRDEEREVVEGSAAFAAKLAEMLSGAEFNVAVLSLGLNRDLYAREDVVDALKRFVLSSDRVQVRVLVADARAATGNGNAFLELARKLPSRIKMREMTPEKRETEGPEIIIVDGRRMLERTEQRMLQAHFYPHPVDRVQQKLKDYDALWDESEPVIELSGMRF